MKFFKRLIIGIIVLVVVIVLGVVASIFGPQIWTNIRGESDYSVELPADAQPVTDRYDVLQVKGDDGEEYPVVLPRVQPPAPPDNRFTTGPEGLAAIAAEEVLTSSGIPAEVYVVEGETSGEPVMVVTMEIDQGFPTSNQNMEETITEIISACRSEGVDLAAIGVTFYNEDGEPLMAFSSSTADAVAFRDGEIPNDEVMDHLGLSLIDRKAIIDLLTELRR